MSPPPSKIGNASTNRNVGSVAAPSPTAAGAELTTDVSTFLARPATDGNPVVIYNGDRKFAQVTLVLETAGPVAVGNKQNLLPVLSGKGTLLDTGIPVTFYIAKGNKLYVATSSINRIKITIQPVPWLEQLTGLLGSIAGVK